MREESEKARLKLNIKKTKILASSPIMSWQIEGEIVEAVTDFFFLGSKVTVACDCSHEIRRGLLLGLKAVTNLDRFLLFFFPVVTYDCGIIKKTERQRIDAFELWC